ncbi:Alpha-terpineol synthase [Nymphaea thermarum]|nr:Alpha-terpineol synthase [Nymphaea thermarum]
MECFSRFKDQSGWFSKNPHDDVRGLLSLYEASQLACEGETCGPEDVSTDNMLCRFRSIEGFAGSRPKSILRHSRGRTAEAKWWRDLGLGEHISFARDRLVECYFMAVGKMHEPRFSQYIMQLTRVSYLMATVEDIFTFLIDLLSSTLGQWASIYRAYLVETKWHHAKLTPRFKEYLSNIRAAMTGHILILAYFFLSQNIEEQVIQQLQSESNIINLSSMIVHLSADLRRSMCRVVVVVSTPATLQENSGTVVSLRLDAKFPRSQSSGKAFLVKISCEERKRNEEEEGAKREIREQSSASALVLSLTFLPVKSTDSTLRCLKTMVGKALEQSGNESKRSSSGKGRAAGSPLLDLG